MRRGTWFLAVWWMAASLAAASAASAQGTPAVDPWAEPPTAGSTEPAETTPEPAEAPPEPAAVPPEPAAVPPLPAGATEPEASATPDGATEPTSAAVAPSTVEVPPLPAATALPATGEPRAIDGRLRTMDAIRRGLLERAGGQRFDELGTQRYLVYQASEWDLAARRVRAFRAAAAELAREPVMAYLAHPRFYLRLSELLKWGELTCVVLPYVNRAAWRRLLPVIEPARPRRGSPPAGVPGSSATTASHG